MKRLSLLLLTVFALAVSVQAGMLRLSANNHHQLNKNRVAGTCLTQDQLGDLMQNFNESANRVITTMPEGELRTYLRTGGQGIFGNNDNIGLDVQSGKMDIVFADGNVVYMKNILFNCNINYGVSWVQGTLSDDGTTITVPMGQPIFWSDYYNSEVVLCMGRTEIVLVDGQPDHIEFTKDEDVTESTAPIIAMTPSLSTASVFRCITPSMASRTVAISSTSMLATSSPLFLLTPRPAAGMTIASMAATMATSTSICRRPMSMVTILTSTT